MNNYIEIAKNLSEENLKTNAEGPFGACIVKDGKIKTTKLYINKKRFRKFLNLFNF